MKRILLCLASFAVALFSASADEVSTRSNTAPAQKIYIDPATGRKTAPPPPQLPTLPPAATNRLSTSSQGLKEVPVTEKPGGFKVHLGGRFQSTLTVSNSADGKVTTRCVE